MSTLALESEIWGGERGRGRGRGEGAVGYDTTIYTLLLSGQVLSLLRELLSESKSLSNFLSNLDEHGFSLEF